MRTFAAGALGRPIIVINEKSGRRTVSRLRNWHCVDKGISNSPGFSWGDESLGSRCTAYSVLRELYGRKAAERHSEWFLGKIITFMRPDQDLRLTEEGIAAALGDKKSGAVPKVLLEEQRERKRCLQIFGSDLGQLSSEERSGLSRIKAGFDELDRVSKRLIEEMRAWEARTRSSRRG